MTSLIACIGSGKGTWIELQKLIEAESWDNVFLITNSYGKDRFKADATYILVDDLQSPHVISPIIISQLKGKIKHTEVALNISSGSGNMHMAILSALLKLGLGIRLVAFVDSGVEEI